MHCVKAMWPVEINCFDCYGVSCSRVQKIGQPVVNRFRQWSERPQAFELLGQTIQQMFKVLDAYSDKVALLVCYVPLHTMF